MACPLCDSAVARSNGRDRQGRQVCRRCGCRCRCTARTGTPCAGYRCPPDSSALAVRWSLRYRLRSADVAELLVEWGVVVDPATVYAWVRAFAPLDEDAARPYRNRVGSAWSVDATDVKVAGAWADVYRARDGRGQVVDVDVSTQRATADAATCFRRAIAATGIAPDVVTTDRAAADPPALAAARPAVVHETGQRVQPRSERDQQHLQGRLRGTRGGTTLGGARVRCRAHAFRRNLRGHCSDCERLVDTAPAAPPPPVVRAWDASTSD